MKFLLSYNLNFFIQQLQKLAFGGGNENLVGESTGGNEQIFGQWGHSPPSLPSPSKEKPEKGREKFEKKLNEKMGGLERNSYKTD